MKKVRIILSILIPSLLCILLLLGCKPDEVKSSEKKITTFNFSAVTPVVVGVIDEVTKKINLTVPNGTNVTSLVPTIQLSSKSTVSPASGEAQNFANPLTYTVTAEDGSMQAYSVVVGIAKSTEKKITSFKFSALTPEVVGVIDESAKKVNLVVPNAISLTALVPTLEISANSTSSPASGIAKDFTNPVIYSITAQDGSKQDYTVTVTIDPTVNFTIDSHIGTTDVEQFAYFLIKGNNFGTDAGKIRVEMINKSTSQVTAITSFVITNNTSIGLFIPGTATVGQYNIKVIINNQQRIMPETFTVTLPSPQIVDVDKTSVIQGENLTITGTRFMVTGNIIKLNATSTSFTLSIVSESTTSIVVKVPIGTPVDSYTLSITSNGKERFYNTAKINVLAIAGTPVITSLDKVTYKRGETITITGQNLKKAGVASNVNFLPFPSGTTLVRSAVPNSDGTQLTYVIPNDFATGNYVILVEVDFLYSGEYPDVIKINP
jgi:hypothetical protein